MPMPVMCDSSSIVHYYRKGGDYQKPKKATLSKEKEREKKATKDFQRVTEPNLIFTLSFFMNHANLFSLYLLLLGNFLLRMCVEQPYGVRKQERGRA